MVLNFQKYCRKQKYINTLHCELMPCLNATFSVRIEIGRLLYIIECCKVNTFDGISCEQFTSAPYKAKRNKRNTNSTY